MLKKKNKKIIAVSGYFNPIHVGHLRLLKEAKKLGDFLVVIVNNDKQVKLKGSVPFMKEKDRVEIVKEIRCVDKVVLEIDNHRSVCKTLTQIKPDIFANGGDRNKANIPEDAICKKYNIKMVDNVGGKKLRSSSTILKKTKKYIK